MSKHTEGPLSVGPTHHEHEGKNWLTFSSQADILHPNGLTSLACVDVAEEEGEANARLFAAAPELLAACEALMAVISRMEWGQRWPGTPHAEMDIAREAVAKATT